MGWWGFGVMAGDGPYDFMSTFDDVSGVSKLTAKYEDADIPKKEMKLILAKIKKMVTPTVIKKLVKEVDKGEMDSTEVGYGVLGVWMMGYGIKITATLKKDIINATNMEIKYSANDFSDPSARKKALRSFIKQLTKYDGSKPTQLKDADEGLFAAMVNHMASGEEGMLNK